MISTEKQKLAQKRNYFKWYLKGMIRSSSSFEMIFEENITYERIKFLHKKLLEDFNYNSLKLGLKVSPKCWCGKLGKYVPEYLSDKIYQDGNNSGLVCKQHIKQIY